MSTLTLLVDDILGRITEYIDAGDLYSLYITCPLMSSKLKRAVTSFCYPFSTQCVSFLSNFPMVRQIDIGVSTPYGYYQNKQIPMPLTLSKVQKLHFNAFGCEASFQLKFDAPSLETKASTSYIDLHKMYPYLTDLYLSDLGTHVQKLLDQIPETILRLGLFQSIEDPKRAAYLHSLPPHLIEYNGGVAYKPKGAFQFPSSLEIWRAPVSEALLQALPTTCLEIQAEPMLSTKILGQVQLPSLLETVVIRIDENGFVFPRTLRTLTIFSSLASLDFGDMASSLPCLEALHITFDREKSVFLAKIFPKSLTSFKVNDECSLPPKIWSTASLRYIACVESFTEDTLSSMANSLRTLILTVPQKDSSFQFSYLNALSSLTELELDSKQPLSVESLYPYLTHLQVNVLIVPFNQSKFWPPYLSKLFITLQMIIKDSKQDQDISTTETEANSIIPPTTTPCILLLPPSIKRISIPKITHPNLDWLQLFSKIPDWKHLDSFSLGQRKSPATLDLLPTLAKIPGLVNLSLAIGPSEVFTRDHLKLLKRPLRTLVIRSSKNTTLSAEDMKHVPRTVRAIQLPPSPGAVGFSSFLPRNIGFNSIPTPKA